MTSNQDNPTPTINTTPRASIIEQRLLSQYGALLDYSTLAQVLGAPSANSLKVIMASSQRRAQPGWSVLADARVRLGRRVFFRTDAIARVIAGDEA